MTKNYITVAKGINPTHKWFILDDEINSNDCPFVAKKILIKHKEILDAYLKDSDSHISWKISDDSEIWHCRKPFIEEYKESYIYRIIKEDKNNFKEYGFEADFEGEILKEYENQFVGMVYQNEANFGCSWDKKGRCLQPNGFGYINMNLKPIKKEWYENPDNFPCIATKDGKNFAVIESIDYLKRVCIYPRIIDFRTATKEEVLSLLVEK